jgi:hypothetical protein
MIFFKSLITDTGILIYKPLYFPSEKFRDLLLLIYTILKFIVIIYLYIIVDSIVINIIKYIRRGRTSNIIIIKLIEIDLVKELRSIINYYDN